MSLDEFTSVQWDRDDPTPHSIFNDEEHPLIEEEGSEETEDQPHTEVSLKGSVLDQSSTINDFESTPQPTDKKNPHSQEQSPAQQSSQQSPQQNEYYIHSTVSEPLKEMDGSNTYISYLIKTTSNNPVFQTSSFQIRRRFSDFNFLYQCLLNDFPTVIVPPLPNKQRLEYIKGDRFSEHFTMKRAISLNNFLSRVSKHESLRNAKIYHIFLENSDYWNTYKQNLNLSGHGISSASSDSTNEKISDYIMNLFKKPVSDTGNSKEFQEILIKANKLQENLIKIDKVYSKVIKKQSELSTNFSKFGDELIKLNRLINDDSNNEETVNELDTALVKNFKTLSNNLHKFSHYNNTLIQNIDYEYLTSLKDLEHYIIQLKNSIRLKDSKLLDYELLTNYLNKARNEKQTILHNGTGSTLEATMRFLSRKLESFTGTDVAGYGSNNSVNNKILKLNSKITKLEKESAELLEIFQNFEQLVLKEYYNKFEVIKTEEINQNLAKLSKFNLNFYNSVLKNWADMDDSVIPSVANINRSNDYDLATQNAMANLKLSEDSKLFDHNEITKNEEVIKEDYEKLIKVHEERIKEKKGEALRLQKVEEERAKREELDRNDDEVESNAIAADDVPADVTTSESIPDDDTNDEIEESNYLSASMLG